MEWDKQPINPTPYCRPCEAFTSDNDAMVEAGSEFPVGGKRKWGRKPSTKPTTEIAATVSGRAE